MSNYVYIFNLYLGIDLIQVIYINLFSFLIIKYLSVELLLKQQIVFTFFSQNN